MLTRSDYRIAQVKAAQLFREAGVAFSMAEAEAISVADFGLSNLSVEGGQIMTLVSTERIAFKLIALFPGQVLPEHWHPAVGDDPGKEETLRVMMGPVNLGVEGDGSLPEDMPAGKAACYTCRQVIAMDVTDQYTLAPGEKHWLQGGPTGAVVASFSTTARDILDLFTDPAVQRETVVVPDETH